MNSLLNKGDIVKTSLSDSTLVVEVAKDKAILFTGRKFLIAHGVEKKSNEVFWDYEDFYDEIPDNIFYNYILDKNENNNGKTFFRKLKQILRNEQEKTKYQKNPDRLKLEEELLNRGFNSPYKLEEFNSYQLNQILIGLELGLDVSKYAKPEIKGWQMKDRWKTLSIEKSQENAAIKLLEKHDFSWSQKLEIIKGCKQAFLIAELYANPKLDFQQMKEIRLEWTEKYYKLHAMDFEDEVIDIDLNSYIKSQYTKEDIEKHIAHEKTCEEKAKDILSKYNFGFYQKIEILEGIDKNLDISQYANPQFEWYHMEEIRLGLEKRLDVTKYSNPKYNFFQMREIRIGLELGVDVSPYINSEFDDMQIRMIREGLEKGVDVSSYAKLENDWETMESILNELETDLEDDCELEPYNIFERNDIKEKILGLNEDQGKGFSYGRFCEYVRNKMSTIYQNEEGQYEIIEDTQSLQQITPDELGWLTEEETLKYIYDNNLFEEMEEIISKNPPYIYNTKLFEQMERDIKNLPPCIHGLNEHEDEANSELEDEWELEP